MESGLDDFPFDWIAEDFKKGNCIPFLGAGASAFPTGNLPKPPTARSLAFELAKESTYPDYRVAMDTADPSKEGTLERQLRARLDCENLMLVSSWVEHGRGDRPRLHRKLRDYLANPDIRLPSNALHTLLARTARESPMAILTTNYDDLIDLALEEQQVPFDLFVVAIDRPGSSGQQPGATFFRPAGGNDFSAVTTEDAILDIGLGPGEVRLKRTVLIKIHGHIDRNRADQDTFVITEEDYVSFLGRMGQHGCVIPADLMALMPSRTLLFLGYGLRDWNLRVLLDRLSQVGGPRKKAYAVTSNIGMAETRLWERRNVEVFNVDLNQFVPRLDQAMTRQSLTGS